MSVIILFRYRIFLGILILASLLLFGCQGHDGTIKNGAMPAPTGALGSEAAFLRDLSSRVDKLDRFVADLPEGTSLEVLSAILSEQDFLQHQSDGLEGSFSLTEVVKLEAEERRAIFDRQLIKFQQIATSNRVSKAVKREMWRQLCRRWELDPRERPARLVWDASLSMPTVVFPPALRLDYAEDSAFSIHPEKLVSYSFEGYLFLEEKEDYYIEVAQAGYVTEVRDFSVDWKGLREMHFDLKPLKFVKLSPVTEMGMVRIDPGRFMMGFAGKHENERPVHEVSISRGFWIGETEVTQAQFATILDLPSQRFVGEKLPVHNISWTDAREFCARLTKRERAVGLLPEGYVYRLPTEAEWEYACRADTGRAFGANPQAMTWHTGNAEAQAKPVAERLPNPWGIHDMHGNVLEWCLDGISEYPEESQIDPLRGGYEKIKITRGGAWTKPLKFCRSSHRHSWLFGLKKSDIGFRVVLAPDLAHRD